MKLSNIKITNYRNYKGLSHVFEKSPLFLVGPNATGKTNFLEAIRVLSLSKSFRTKSDTELILFDEEFTRLEGEAKLDGKTSRIEVTIEKNGRSLQKIIKLNGKQIRAIDLVGKLTTVLFSPDDLNLVYSSPSIRRKYLDITICQLDPKYCRDLNEYNSIVRSRNKLLWNIREGRSSYDELHFWNDKLVNLGENIIEARYELIQFYNKKLTDYLEAIDGKNMKLKIEYKSHIPTRNDTVESIKEKLRTELDLKRESEINMARSLAGPHRDDFTIMLSKKNIARYGSRGEVRSAIVALKFAELDFFEKKIGNRPILLLDDIFSELDKSRRRKLSEILGKQQTIITTTDLNFISKEATEGGEVLNLPLKVTTKKTD